MERFAQDRVPMRTGTPAMRCLTYHRVSTNDQDPRLARILASNGVRLAGSVCRTVVFLENAHEPALAFSANGGENITRGSKIAWLFKPGVQRCEEDGALYRAQSHPGGGEAPRTEALAGLFEGGRGSPSAPGAQ